MHNAIIVIPFGLQQILQPKSQWVACISAHGSIHMHANKHTHEKIAQIAEPIFFIGGHNEDQEQNGEGIFNPPIRHVCIVHESIYPNGGKNQDKELYKSVFGQRSSFSFLHKSEFAHK